MPSSSSSSRPPLLAGEHTDLERIQKAYKITSVELTAPGVSFLSLSASRSLPHAIPPSPPLFIFPANLDCVRARARTARNVISCCNQSLACLHHR